MSTIKVTNIEHASTGNGGIQLDNAGHVTVDGLQMPTAGALSNRNLIINGAMQVAQRGTSQTSVSDGSNEGHQTLDRFSLVFSNSAGGVCTVSQATDVPSGEGFSNSYKVDVTTADTSIASTHQIFIEQRIESQNVRNSGWDYTNSSSYITVSFWVKSSKAGTYCFAARAWDVGAKYYIFEYTLAANTWTKVTHSIPGDSTLVFDNDNLTGLAIRWVLVTGTDRDEATADQWNATDTGNAATSNQVNFFDSTSNDFYLTGVQLEVGEMATPFEHRSFGDELRRCQRYFLKSGDIGTSNEWFPGVQTHADIGRATAIALDGLNDRAFIIERFPTTMRASGSVTFYPGRDGVTNDVDNISIYNGNTKVTFTSEPIPSTRGFTGYFQGTSTDARAYTMQYTVDAEL